MIESLAQAVRGAAFAVPGALGAQEGGLIALCGLFDIPAEAALALSLVKRFADLGVGFRACCSGTGSRPGSAAETPPRTDAAAPEPGAGSPHRQAGRRSRPRSARSTATRRPGMGARHRRRRGVEEVRLTRRLAAARPALRRSRPCSPRSRPGPRTIRRCRRCATSTPRFTAAAEGRPGPLPARVEAVGPAFEQGVRLPGHDPHRGRREMGGLHPGAAGGGHRRVQAQPDRDLRQPPGPGGRRQVRRDPQGRGARQPSAWCSPGSPRRTATIPQVDFVVNADNRIQDVLLNGDVSEVAAQRNALSAPLKSGGADGVREVPPRSAPTACWPPNRRRDPTSH